MSKYFRQRKSCKNKCCIRKISKGTSQKQQFSGYTQIFAGFCSFFVTIFKIFFKISDSESPKILFARGQKVNVHRKKIKNDPRVCGQGLYGIKMKN